MKHIHIKYLALSILSILIFSRCHKPDSSITIIDLDNTLVGKPFDFYELYESYKPVLDKEGNQINSGSWLEGIIYRGGDKYIKFNILRGSISIHNFSNNSKIIDVGKVGNNLSKGEYSDMNKVKYDEAKQLIYILSNIQGTILRYTYSGVYLGYIPIINKNPGYILSDDKMSAGRICDDFLLLPNGDILIHYAWWDGNRSPFNFGVIDTLGNVKYSKKTFREFNGHTRHAIEMSSYVYNDQLYVCDFADTVYLVKENHFEPKYVFSSKVTLEEMLKDDKSSYVNIPKIKQTKKIPYQIRVIMENKRYLFFQGMPFNGKYPDVYYYYYDKLERKTYKLPKAHMGFTKLPDGPGFEIRFIHYMKNEYPCYDGALYQFIRKN